MSEHKENPMWLESSFKEYVQGLSQLPDAERKRLLMGEFKCKQYLVVEGYVRSRNDRQRHFINSFQLMSLYGVKPEDCEIVRAGDRRVETNGFIVLRPRADGNYELPTRRDER